jgi:putative NADH-flavin reductase
MRILILGSTGRTGRLLLDEALARKHDVKVLVRDPSKIKARSTSLTIVEGTATNRDILDRSMEGCDAILSVLNISRTSDFPWSPLRTPKDFLSRVMTNIIHLAPSHKIRRLIFSSAWGAAETRGDIPGWFRWFIEHSNILYAYEDHAKQEELVSRSSLEWTSVRPTGLINSMKKKEVIVSINGQPKPKLLISRSNVARFMIDTLENNLYLREKVTISQ